MFGAAGLVLLLPTRGTLVHGCLVVRGDGMGQDTNCGHVFVQQQSLVGRQGCLEGETEGVASQRRRRATVLRRRQSLISRRPCQVQVVIEGLDRAEVEETSGEAHLRHAESSECLSAALLRLVRIACLEVKRRDSKVRTSTFSTTICRRLVINFGFSLSLDGVDHTAQVKMAWVQDDLHGSERDFEERRRRHVAPGRLQHSDDIHKLDTREKPICHDLRGATEQRPRRRLGVC
mmetsp:Transcript_24277/g.59933  ORF Transcript_24277/g.59933 Transcript_24277/m.59933 type:complete len:233 (+) Transcript_24277:153-851(+)